jgi:hypothetical protein
MEKRMEKARVHMRCRTSEVGPAVRDRAAWVGNLKTRTTAMLASARRERRAGWSAVKGTLEGARRAAEAEWRDQSRAIQEVLGDLHLSRGEMAQDLAHRLASFVRAMRSSVSSLLAEAGTRRILQAAAGRDARREVRGEIRARTAQLASEAQVLLGASRRGRSERQRRLRADLAHGGREHHEAHGAMAHKGHESEAAPATTEPREVEPAPRKAEEAKRSRDTWAKLSDEDKILQVIGEHPDGITATQIGELVELHPSMVGRIATELAERGAVEKNEGARLYFPISPISPVSPISQQ